MGCHGKITAGNNLALRLGLPVFLREERLCHGAKDVGIASEIGPERLIESQ